MRNKLIWIASLLVVLTLPAASATAAPRGGGHGGFHGGGRTRIFVGGGWGWGWGWPYYGYSGYPYDGYGYRSAASSWGAVKTDVEPEDARVFLDGKYIGTADDFDGWPDKLYLRPGRYKLEFRLNGYEPLTLNVRARAGATLEVDNHLRKLSSRVSQAPDPPKMEGDVPRFFGKRRDGDSARPYVRDRDRDDEPSIGMRDEDSDQAVDSDQPAEAPPRDAPQRDAGRDRDSWRDHRQPDSTVTARPVRSDRARLAIHAEPSDAAVYVDDRFVGTADELGSMERGIVVSPGKHTVTISRPGYRDRSTEIDVASGKTETVKVSLSK